MSRCAACEAELVWCLTETGKRMPLSKASEQTRVIVEPQPDGTLLAKVRKTYVSHFSDCPSAKEFRKPRAT